mmetsp:Transcript_5086/g.12226  ORF Transcript_5086/g.12226 Transcript_5086/m.12226 type:complete len:246 (-) Transcript_5086:531-1268(-)
MPGGVMPATDRSSFCSVSLVRSTSATTSHVGDPASLPPRRRVRRWELPRRALAMAMHPRVHIMQLDTSRLSRRQRWGDEGSRRGRSCIAPTSWRGLLARLRCLRARQSPRRRGSTSMGRQTLVSFWDERSRLVSDATLTASCSSIPPTALNSTAAPWLSPMARSLTSTKEGLASLPSPLHLPPRALWGGALARALASAASAASTPSMERSLHSWCAALSHTGHPSSALVSGLQPLPARHWHTRSP